MMFIDENGVNFHDIWVVFLKNIICVLRASKSKVYHGYNQELRIIVCGAHRIEQVHTRIRHHSQYPRIWGNPYQLYKEEIPDPFKEEKESRRTRKFSAIHQSKNRFKLNCGLCVEIRYVRR